MSYPLGYDPSQNPTIGDTGSPSYQQCQSNLQTLDPILNPDGNTQWELQVSSDLSDKNTWYLVAYGPSSRDQCVSAQESLDNALDSDPRTAGQWYTNCTCADSDSDPDDPNTQYILVIYPA